MDPQMCYICSTQTNSYSRDLFKTKSKYSETRICDFIQRFVSADSSEKMCLTITSGNNEDFVCIECLNKIDEYDLATTTAKRVETELRILLLRREISFEHESKSINTEELFVPSIETIEAIDEYKQETYDSGGDIAVNESDNESSADNFDSDDDEYIPPAGKKQTQKLLVKCEQESKTKQHHDQKCTKCNREFKSVAGLARHKHTQDANNKPDQSTATYKCTTCSDVFCTKSQYDNHLKQHKDEDDQFKCPICGFDLKEKPALDSHVKLHADLTPLQCVLCKKTFKQRGALVRHMRIHSGLHFYQCHRCGKGFVHKSSFEMHMMAHDNIRKKKCPHCEQMFRSSSHLNRHLRIHTGSKPFSCPVCSQKFAQRYNMNVHLRLHDTSSNRQKPEKSHVCKFCNSSFARLSKLEEHLKKNHEAAIPHTSIANNLINTVEI